MRKFIVGLVLAFAIAVPVVTSADSGDTVYLPNVSGSNACGIEFTFDQARAWWNAYFAAPVDLNGVSPGLLPGSKVLSASEFVVARADNAPGNGLPKAPRNFNPLDLPVTPGIVGADGVEFCPTDSIAAAPTAAPVTASRYAASIAIVRARLSHLSVGSRAYAREQARLAYYLSR